MGAPSLWSTLDHALQSPLLLQRTRPGGTSSTFNDTTELHSGWCPGLSARFHTDGSEIMFSPQLPSHQPQTVSGWSTVFNIQTPRLLPSNKHLGKSNAIVCLINKTNSISVHKILERASPCIATPMLRLTQTSSTTESTLSRI